MSINEGDRNPVEIALEALREIVRDCELRIKNGHDNGDSSTLKKCREAIQAISSPNDPSDSSVKDIAEDDQKRGYFASPDWNHIFVGNKVETTRWIYDCKTEKLVSAQVFDVRLKKPWVNMDEIPAADLLESIHENLAIESPDRFGLLWLDSLPSSWEEIMAMKWTNEPDLPTEIEPLRQRP